MAKKTMKKEQKKMVKRIMKENDRQRKVDKIVRNVKRAIEIYKRESIQGKVDEIVAMQQGR